MPTQKVTREEIVLKAIDLFRRQGYHRTSMSDLAGAVGLLKGSFYHYFESKEALMQSVLLFVKDSLELRVYPIAYQEDLLPQERLEKMLRRLYKALLSSEGGCIVGNTTLETALLVPEFRVILRAIFDGWIQAQTHLYALVHSPEKAKDLAEQTVMEFEGAIMLSKLYDNNHHFEACYQRAIQRLATS